MEFTLQCLDNVTIAAAVDDAGAYSGPDGDLEFVIASAWNSVADATFG